MTRQTIIAIVAAVGIIMVIGALVVLPRLTGQGNTPPEVARVLPETTPATPQTTFVIPRETGPLTVPPSGVWVHITYLGSWKATYGMPGSLQTVENSGERYMEIPHAGGQINLVAGKSDSSTNHALVAEIIKDGTSLASGSTSAAYGNVTLSADAGNAPVTPAPAPTPRPGDGTLINTPVTTSSAGRTPVPVTTAPVCPSDKMSCNGNCTDTRTDNSNCGYCENSCPAGKYCLNGNCAVTCTAEQTSCPDGCSNLMTDPRHCGSCGNSCPKGLICFMGRCDSPATPMPVPL